MSALTSRWKSAYQDMDVKSISTFDAPQSITTIDEFDGPAFSAKERSDSTPPDWPCQEEASTVMVDVKLVRSQYLLMSILEFLAKQFGKNLSHSEKLFQTFRKWLCGTELSLPFFCEMDEMASVRNSCYVAFSRLIQHLIQSVPPDDKMRPPRCVVGAACSQLRCLVPLKRSLPIGRMSLPDILQLIPSRFEDEFVELGVLGKGGFGKVMKVRNRIDGCEYAVKRVVFKRLNQDIFTKVLREVKVFASLDHRNIVRYHSAWLEHSAADQQKLDTAKSDQVVTEGSSIVFVSETRQMTSEAVLSAVKTRNAGLNGVSKSFDISEQFVQSDNGSGTGKMSQTGTDSAESTASSDSEDSRSDKGCPLSMENKQLCTLSEPNLQTRHTAPRLVLYIQMQLCVLSLREWLLQRNQKVSSVMKCAQVSSSQCNAIFRQIVEGVHYIHSRGLMHRDLKPANIFLYGPEEEAKIGDFGLARDEMVFEDLASEPVPVAWDGFPRRHRQHSSCLSSSSTPTSGIGTSTYAPPEQLTGGFYNAKVDMYSLGVILTELFHPLSTGMERVICLQGVRGGQLPEELTRTWPQQSQLIQQLVSSDPSKRLDAGSVLRMDFLKTQDELVTQLKATVEQQASQMKELMELLAEKEDMIKLLQQQLTEANNRTHLYDSQSI